MTINQDQNQGQEEFWRSVDEREGAPSFPAELDYEYTPSAKEIAAFHAEEGDAGVSRRKFMGVMGASMALAGATMTGCIRKPYQKILPYNKRPEEIIPGKPIHFATSMHVGNNVIGLLVESQDGRPTKVEGNPDHPMTKGASTSWAQAAALDIYDPDRSQDPSKEGRESTWKSFFSSIQQRLKLVRNASGEGLALLVEDRPSPTYQALLAEFKRRYPKAQLFRHDPAQPQHQQEGLGLIGGDDLVPFFNLEKARTILSIGSNFLGHEGDHLRNTRLFSQGRRLENNLPVNRLYAVEAAFTPTGASADHRYSVPASQQGDFLVALSSRLLDKAKVPAAAKGLVQELNNRLGQFKSNNGSVLAGWDKALNAIAEDLLSHRGQGVIMVGDAQPARVHALAAVLNEALGNVGKNKPITMIKRNYNVAKSDLLGLASAINGGSLQMLVMLGGNPVYTAPADLDFAALLQKVPVSIHHSLYMDETSKLATWHLPATHFLEAWGDLQSTDHTISIQQPLIAPLYKGRSELELLAYFVGGLPTKGHKLLRQFWKSQYKGKGSFETAWRKWLHDGLVKEGKPAAQRINLSYKDLAASWKGALPKAKADTLEVNFVVDGSVYDGRYANNAWLQELPDIMSKLTWDNAAYVSPKTARERKLRDGQFVELNNNGQKLEVPVFRVPGIAANTVILPLGYGRSFEGRVCKKAGFNAYQLRTQSAPEFVMGVTLKELRRVPYMFASTQEHGRLEVKTPFGTYKRPAIFRQASLEEYKKNPKFVEKYEVIHDKSHLRSLWDRKSPKDKKTIWSDSNENYSQQWGMSIDLNLCTGCNVCTIACQSENNISVVGKERVAQGREMHWIRMDRYFTGDEEKGTLSAVFQPVGCVHCENAPCENVCPVAATVHSPDGMNDMAYNRCIGTRYCANNCPYKVRRFNFFNFSKENDALLPTLKMQRNPDVTVRFRGVMEKCSYCVQRINEAKIEAKSKGSGLIPDGKVVTACQQACPTQAIAFGDVADKNTRVSKLKQNPRDYAVLAELNIKPRTTYLAKVRNPNPKLV